MQSKIQTITPENTMAPIGPYSHVAKAGGFITIGGTAGVDPSTGQLAGPGISEQTLQILDAFEVMLASVGSDLAHVLHINVFLTDMRDFEAMNAAYADRMQEANPARTSVQVASLPKPGARITMNATAVEKPTHEPV